MVEDFSYCFLDNSSTDNEDQRRNSIGNTFGCVPGRLCLLLHVPINLLFLQIESRNCPKDIRKSTMQNVFICLDLKIFGFT